MFGAKQLSLNRDTESVVALTPNVELGSRFSAFASQFQSQLSCESREPNCEKRVLVELTGIEPVASWLQTRRSPS